MGSGHPAMRRSHARTTPCVPSKGWCHSYWKPFQILFVCWVLSTGGRRDHHSRGKHSLTSGWISRVSVQLEAATNASLWVYTIRVCFQIYFNSASASQQVARSVMCSAGPTCPMMSYPTQQHGEQLAAPIHIKAGREVGVQMEKENNIHSANWESDEQIHAAFWWKSPHQQFLLVGICEKIRVRSRLQPPRKRSWQHWSKEGLVPQTGSKKREERGWY